MTECSIPECTNDKYARGWCVKHYSRWRKHGDPRTSLHGLLESDPARYFAARTERKGACLIWTGAKSEDGYGYAKVAGAVRKAHRVAWEASNGPLPDGAEVDHTCWTPSCVEPKHLRLASRHQNNRNLGGAKSNNRSTGVRNVYPVGNRYVVQVRRGDDYYRRGPFDTLQEADSVATRLRDELFGDYSGRPTSSARAILAAALGIEAE